MSSLGANSGVGFATAKVIASASEVFHVIMASRSREKAESAMSEIKAAGTKGSLSTVQLDVTDENSIQQAAALVQNKFGRLDVLVNNAAVGSRDPAVKTRFRLCMDTNVIGPALVSAAFRPLLLKSQKPYSIYVSSGVGSLARASDPTSPTHRDLSNGEAYRASKAALNMVALQESIEFNSAGLKVFAACPGFVRSNLRGPSEEARSGWGKAKDPAVSGEMILNIIQGHRDADAGRFVHRDGVYPW
jgi:NAD(P)-dependent dehydrogenase (short-subunit alcohol dehydrogenase family)